MSLESIGLDLFCIKNPKSFYRKRNKRRNIYFK